MFQSYFKLALKNLFRHRAVSSIHLVGLSAGFAVCALIGLFVRHHLLFDRMHAEGYARTARLVTTMKYPGASERTSAYSSMPMGLFLQEVFEKDVEAFCRLRPIDEDIIFRNGANRVTAEQIFSADSNFFQVFGFRLRQGDPLQALAAPRSMVVTRGIAEQAFGTPDVLGQTLSKTYVSPHTQADTTEFYTITGVLEELPASSHLQFDILLSPDQKPYWAYWQPGADQDWHMLGALTYVRLRSEQTDLATLNRLIPERLQARMQGSQNVAHRLQPMREVHLDSRDIADDKASNFQPFDRQHLKVFGLIGLFVLFIAGINYANLSTVMAGRRMREIAVRKAIGADRGAIVAQFLAESTLMSGLAVCLAAGLLWLSRPWLEKIDYPGAALRAFTENGLWLYAVVAVFLFGLAVGAYPAFFMGKAAPARGLRGQGEQGASRRHGGLVSVLVTGQFAAAVVLIFGALVCYRQLQYIQKTDLGYATTQVLTAELGIPNLFKSQVLREKIAALPGVESVSLSDRALGGDAVIQQGVRYVFQGKEEHVSLPCLSVDDRFLGFYGMKLAYGRPFSAAGVETGTEYLINETLAHKIGWGENAVGQSIRYAWLPSGTVVGVLKDFHFNTLRHRIEPICIRAGNMASSINIKVRTGDLPATLAALDETWRGTITDRPFDYEWLDAQFAQAYAADLRLSRLTGIGAALAVLIACLGLFALAMFAAETRRKEIGIRKVLGASVAGITGLLAKDFLKLVLVAIGIASPIAYYFMQRWLADFAYRIDIQWWMFVAAGAAAVAIAFLTVGFQGVRAALANPVTSLKSE